MKAIRFPFQACFTLIVLTSNLLAQKITVDSATPPSTKQGTTLDVTIKGRGFAPGARSDYFVTGTGNPGGVTVNSTTFVDSTTLISNITAESEAVISNYDIQVTNSNGRTGKGIEKFAVESSSALSAVELTVTIEDGYAIGPDLPGVDGCTSCGGPYVPGVDGVGGSEGSSAKGITDGGNIMFTFATTGNPAHPPTPRQIYFDFGYLIEALADLPLPESGLYYAAAAMSGPASLEDGDGNPVFLLPGEGDCPSGTRPIRSGPLQTMVGGDCQIHRLGIGFFRYPSQDGDPYRWRIQFHNREASFDDNTSHVVVTCLADSGGAAPRCSRWQVEPALGTQLGDYQVARLVRVDDPPAGSKFRNVMVVTPLGYFQMPFRMILEAME